MTSHDNVTDIVERLLERSDLPSTFDFVGEKVEGLFDQENRHKRGANPTDYLQSWLSMLRPFAFASKSDSWGELEKLLCIVMRNYIEMSRECGQAADVIKAQETDLATLRKQLENAREALERISSGRSSVTECSLIARMALKGQPC